MRCGFSLSDARSLTIPEAESYLGIFNGRTGGGNPAPRGKQVIPLRRKPKK